MKNKAQLDGMPVWFDGKSINEALFCEEFLQTHKIIFTNGAFFTPEGRVTDELPLRGEIFEELKCCAVSNIPRKISNIVELMKLAALVDELDSATDEARIQEIYNTILTTMADQCLTTPLIYTRQLAIYSDAVASYTFPTDASFTSVQNIHLN